MRTETSLSLLAILMSFISGLLVLNVNKVEETRLSAPEIGQELKAFESKDKSARIFSLSALLPFLDPKNQLPFYHEFSASELQVLKDLRCGRGSPEGHAHPALNKAIIWHRHLCGLGELPDAFFQTAPFFHPSGHSYAYLHGSRVGPDKIPLGLVHAMELAQWKSLALGSPQSFLSKLGWRELYRVARAEKLVIGEEDVFIKQDGESESYRVYGRGAWEAHWQGTRFMPRPLRDDQICYFKDGSVCWNFDPKKGVFRRLNPYSLMLTLSILLTLASLWLLVNRIRRRQAEEGRLKFALEMLAHEIRTPVTSMTLHLDALREEFDSHSPKDQTVLLRLFDQVQRLKRIVQTSENYLRKDLGTSVLKVNVMEISSLRSLVAHSLDPFVDEIEYSQTGPEVKVELDPYWASICIKNVVENALVHGLRPVQVTLGVDDDSWSLRVQDQGQTEFTSQKGRPGDKGMGVGLKLVRQILDQTGGKMEIQNRPTRVTLRFRRSP